MGLFIYPLKDPSFCAHRGRHGPYVNREVYLNFPGWEKVADCAVCGSTVALPAAASETRPDRFGSGDH